MALIGSEQGAMQISFYKLGQFTEGEALGLIDLNWNGHEEPKFMGNKPDWGAGPRVWWWVGPEGRESERAIDANLTKGSAVSELALVSYIKMIEQSSQLEIVPRAEEFFLEYHKDLDAAAVGADSDAVKKLFFDADKNAAPASQPQAKEPNLSKKVTDEHFPHNGSGFSLNSSPSMLTEGWENAHLASGPVTSQAEPKKHNASGPAAFVEFVRGKIANEPSKSLVLSAFVVLATIVIIWALRNTHLLAFLNCMVRVSFWVAVIPASVLIALIFLSPALFEYAPPKQSLDESPIAKDSAQAPPQKPEASSDHDQNKAQQVATSEDDLGTDARTAQRIGPVLTTSGEPAMDSKLERTIIPRLALEDATVREAVMYLKEASARFDPDGASGINIGLTLDANSASRTLSLKQENTSLRDALFYVASLAEMSVVAMPSGVVIKPAAYAPPASQSTDAVDHRPTARSIPTASGASSTGTMGKTLADCVSKYGSPMSGPQSHQKLPGVEAYQFESSGVKIMVLFQDSKAVGVFYQASSSGGLPLERAQELLEANYSGKWLVDKKTSASVTVRDILDGVGGATVAWTSDHAKGDRSSLMAIYKQVPGALLVARSGVGAKLLFLLQ